MEVKLYNEDCMEGMKRYPDKYFELAIVDPPYGIGEDRTKRPCRGHTETKNHIVKGWDKEPASVEYFRGLERISQNRIIWGANHFISRIPFDSPCWIVWDKLSVGNTADCELAWTSFPTAVKKFKFLWEGFWQGDMANKEQRIHPTQKPVKLYEWLLKNYAKEGDKILDTHLGSGSIAIACYNLDFDLTGFEIDKDYYDGAVNRLEEHKKQQRLFDGN